MAIKRICILGLEDYAMLTGDPAFGTIGGESVQHVLLARAWRDLGFDVSIIVYDHGQPRVTVVDGIKAIASFGRDAGLRGLRFVHPRLTSVVRAMKELDADVYYQSPAAPWTGVAAYFAKQRHKKSIVRIASDSDCMRDQRPAHYSQKRARFRRDRWMFDYGIMNASLVAAQTQKQQQLLAHHYGVRSEILNIAVELPKAGSATQKDIDVLWVGNMRGVKRPDVMLEVARKLPQYRFALIGGAVPGGAALYERTRAEAMKLPNVQFVGGLAYEQTGAWFERSRVHVNTSDYEGFPNTFLQSWIRRLPVVSFCDPDGVVKRLGLGRVSVDAQSMVGDLDALLGDPLECREIGARAYAYADSEFSAPQIAARYVELLDSQALSSMREIAADEAVAPARSVQ
jgi:glycosyltransferase involved in cell wall biosynthesis